MSWIIAIDAGTTGVRAIASRPDTGDGTTHSAYREFTQYFPQPGWVEHDADEIWRITQTVLDEVTEALNQRDDDAVIAAIGITNQRETIVAWDARDGRPRHRAIVWQDRRTTDRCNELLGNGELPRIRQLTGLVLDPYFSGSKAEWLLGPGGVAADEHLRFGTIDTWLLWKLSGGSAYATDVSNASRTMLYDINELHWSPELLELFGIPVTALPEVLHSAGIFGYTTADSPVGAGIAVAGIAGDQQSSLFGQACVSPGMAKNTYGTGSFVLMNVGETRPAVSDALLSTVAWQLPGVMLGSDAATVTHYALEGAVFSTGSAVQWLRDGLGLIQDASEMGPLAESVDDTAGVYLVPAFTGLGSPWWDPDARGAVLGITRGTTRAHIARAVIEAMVYQCRDVVDAMREVSEHEVSELRVDGGAAVMDLLCQRQADELGVPVARSATTDSTAVGATYLAGLGVGMFTRVDEVSRIWRSDRRFDPSGDRVALDASHAMWKQAVQRSIDFA